MFMYTEGVEYWWKKRPGLDPADPCSRLDPDFSFFSGTGPEKRVPAAPYQRD
jgi:hypothetical protein